MKTIRFETEWLGQGSLSHVDGKTLMRRYYPLISKYNILTEAKDECSGQVVTNHIFKNLRWCSAVLCLTDTRGKTKYTKQVEAVALYNYHSFFHGPGFK